MPRLFSPLCAWLFVLLTCSMAHAAPEVELLVEGEDLTPSTTLEVRFTREMVATTALGVPVTPSPIVLQPSLAGTYTWLSKRSGVFTPKQEPAMGTTYKVALAPQLKDAAGKPVAAKLDAQLTTPPFGLATPPEERDDKSTTASLARTNLTFNREVKLEGAEGLFRYINDAGQTIAARVEYGTLTAYARRQAEMPWEIRWDRTRKATATSTSEDEEEGDEGTGEIAKHLVQVSPAEMLPTGSYWRLEVKPGLQALTGKYTLSELTTVFLGRVTPFTLRSVTTSSYLNSGRRATVIFHGSFSEALQPDTAARFFTITPAVPNLRFEVGYEEVTIYGDFARDIDYRLEASAELREADGQPLSGERVRTLRFGPVKPRVYFPAIDGHQMMYGQRKAVITSVNMQSLRIIAQRVPTAQTVTALVQFKKYRDGSQASSGEQYKAVPPKTIPGVQVFEKTITLPVDVDQRQETVLDWTELLPGPKAGMVLLTVEGQPLAAAQAPRAGAQTLVQLTDLGVLWKKAGDELRLSVFSMATGKPVSDAAINLTRSKYIDRATPDRLSDGGTTATKADGTATIKVPNDLAYLSVRLGEDVHTIRLGNEDSELPMAAFRLPIEYSGWSPQKAGSYPLRALLYTERPLYKPGETVHLKGIVRQLERSGLSFLAGTKAHIKLEGPRQKSALFEVETDDRGAFDLELPTEEGVVGNYRVEMHLAGEGDDSVRDMAGFATNFLVADYQPNAFEVNIAMPERFAPGAEIAGETSGRYFFGAALGEAKARWTLQYSGDVFSPEGFTDWSFGESREEVAKTLTLRGEGHVPTGGNLAIRPRLPEAAKGLKRGVLTVELTDQNQQTITQVHEFHRDSASFYLGMKVTEGYNIGHAESMGAMGIAVKPDGTPWPKPVPVKAELLRVIYETVRAQSAGPAMTYRTERREEVVQTAEGKTLVPVRAGSEWAVPPGETTRFTPSKAGEYLLRLSAQDDGGRTVATDYTFTVSGSEPVAWDYRHPSQVELLADKAIYRSGDTARLVVKTPIAGEALVSIERDNEVLRTQRVQLTGNTPTIEVPLLAGDGPNVFVSMILIRGAEQSKRKAPMPEYRYGVCRLLVSEPQTALAVKITPKSPRVEPGQEIVAEVTVHEADGKPTADAEVTFAAVDDGVLALTGYERPQPLKIFEEPFPLRIRTGLSLFDLLPEPIEPADALAGAPLFNKGYLIGGGGAGGAGLKLRTDFPGTALWEPKLRTGANGKVLVKFKAPDALTSYRLVAVAHAGTNRFGSAESKVEISKRLILLSALGQFAHVGDTLVARAVVRNESKTAGVAQVALELDKTAEAPAQPLTASVPLQPGEAKNVDFPVKLRARGIAEWKWTAQMEAGQEVLQDGVLATLTITPPAPILHETYLPELATGQTDLLQGVNPQVLEGTGNVQVNVSNTRLASLRETSQMLLQYPYSCAEQTLSSMIPWLIARDFDGIMPELADEDAYADALAKGMRKLESMKVPGGGLSMWPGGQTTSYYFSAYGVLVLSLIEQQTGEKPALLEELMTAVSEGLEGMGSRSSKVSPDEYALALYALAHAGQVQPEYETMLFQRRAELTWEARALLACAMLQVDGKPNIAAVEKLLDPRAASPEGTLWFGSAARERAIRLLAWTKFRPKDKEVARLTQELLASRRNGQWRTTQENAWALLALSRYFKQVEGEVKPASGTIMRGETKKPFALTKEQLTTREQFEFGPAQALGALAVANPQKSPLFGDVKFTVEPPVALQPRQDRGYGVSRSYLKLDAAGKMQEATDLEVGARVVVVLRVETPVPGHFVAIDDPLPANLEAINPDFVTQGVGGLSAARSEYVADYREIRSDRVLYFCDHLPPGTHTFQYLARVRSAGQVLAPSTKVEEMYRPERFGLGAGGTLESTAK